MPPNTATETRPISARIARPGPRNPRPDPAARVHAFVDRLLYGDWLQDERHDRMKLAMIRAIAEWARGPASA
jgi:hypothetical protein